MLSVVGNRQGMRCMKISLICVGSLLIEKVLKSPAGVFFINVTEPLKSEKAQIRHFSFIWSLGTWIDNTTGPQSVTHISPWHTFSAFLLQLASSGPYGPLLARSGYPGQDASFYNNPMVIICSTVNALTLL